MNFPISRRTWLHPSISGRMYIVEHLVDEDARPEVDPSLYAGLPAAERAKYRRQDKARLTSWERGRWLYIGIAVTIRQQTSSNWANGGLVVGRASIWGVESDSAKRYLRELEDDMQAQAEAEVGHLKEALQ